MNDTSAASELVISAGITGTGANITKAGTGTLEYADPAGRLQR